MLASVVSQVLAPLSFSYYGNGQAILVGINVTVCRHSRQQRNDILGRTARPIGIGLVCSGAGNNKRFPSVGLRYIAIWLTQPPETKIRAFGFSGKQSLPVLPFSVRCIFRIYSILSIFCTIVMSKVRGFLNSKNMISPPSPSPCPPFFCPRPCLIERGTWSNVTLFRIPQEVTFCSVEVVCSWKLRQFLDQNVNLGPLPCFWYPPCDRCLENGVLWFAWFDLIWFELFSSCFPRK